MKQNIELILISIFSFTIVSFLIFMMVCTIPVNEEEYYYDNTSNIHQYETVPFSIGWQLIILKNDQCLEGIMKTNVFGDPIDARDIKINKL